jgi:hypothetical protein
MIKLVESCRNASSGISSRDRGIVAFFMGLTAELQILLQTPSDLHRLIRRLVR